MSGTLGLGAEMLSGADMTAHRTEEERLKPNWDGDPKGGSRWFRPNSRGYGFVVNHPAETRHVIDRTLGGDVIFVSGRFTPNAYRQQCTYSEWLDWVHDAKETRR